MTYETEFGFKVTTQPLETALIEFFNISGKSRRSSAVATRAAQGHNPLLPLTEPST
jgi:hypothetical protein